MNIPIVERRELKVPVIVIRVNGTSASSTFTETFYPTNMETTLPEKEHDVVFGTGKIKVKSLDLHRVKLSTEPHIVGGLNIPTLFANQRGNDIVLFRQHVEHLLKQLYPTYRISCSISTGVETIQIYNENVPVYNFIQAAVTDDPNNLYVNIYDVLTSNGRMLCGFAEFAEFAESVGLECNSGIVQSTYQYRLLDSETTARRVQKDIDRFGTDNLKDSMRGFAGPDVDNIQIVTAGICMQLLDTHKLSVEVAGNANIPIMFITDDSEITEDDIINDIQVRNDVEIQSLIADTEETPLILTWTRNNNLVR